MNSKLTMVSTLGIVTVLAITSPLQAQPPKMNFINVSGKKFNTIHRTDYQIFEEINDVIQAIEDMGELDNTLIFYIAGDNGTSAEGGMSGL